MCIPLPHPSFLIPRSSFSSFVLRLSSIVLLTLSIPLTAQAQTELVANGGFESFDGSGLAVSWSRWWEEIPNPGDGSLNYAGKPDWGPESNPALVQSGGQSQHIGAPWNPWHAGVFQTLSATPGARIRITAYGRAFAASNDFPNPSDGAVQARMQVGADPNGGTEWWAGAVQWSGMANPHDTWQPFSLEITVGESGRVTIFLSANYKGDSRFHLDVWWDSVSAVVVESGPTPTETPAATTAAQPATPVPTAPSAAAATQPAPTAEPSPTPAPAAATEIATSTATTGSVCATLYEDVNGNGKLDGGEKLIAGGQISVAGAVVDLTHSTDGLAESHCFDNLPVGAYTVSVSLPAGYAPTTGNLFTVNVQPAGRAAVQFGAQSSRLAGPAPTPTPTATDSSVILIAVAVGLVVLLAIGGAVGVVVWRTRS